MSGFKFKGNFDNLVFFVNNQDTKNMLSTPRTKVIGQAIENSDGSIRMEIVIEVSAAKETN